MEFKQEMVEDSKHLHTRLEKLRAEKCEMLKQRSDQIRAENQSALKSIASARNSNQGLQSPVVCTF